MYNSVSRYTREVKQYISNHEIKQHSFDVKEVTQIFLSHLDELQYTSTIKQYQTAILLSPSDGPIYLDPAVAETIDQLEPNVSRADENMATNHQRIRQNDQLRLILD